MCFVYLSVILPTALSGGMPPGHFEFASQINDPQRYRSFALPGGTSLRHSDSLREWARLIGRKLLPGRFRLLLLGLTDPRYARSLYSCTHS